MKNLIKKYKNFPSHQRSFKVNESNSIIIINDDKVFAFGYNYRGILGFGHQNKVEKLTLINELCNKQILDIKNSIFDEMVRTLNAKVYCLDFYNNEVFKPKLNNYLNDKHVIDICCSGWHSLVLTNYGEVYAWGVNDCGRIGNINKDHSRYQSIPIEIRGFDGEK